MHRSEAEERVLFVSHEAIIRKHGEEVIRFCIDRNRVFNWAFAVGGVIFWGGILGFLTYVMCLGAMGRGTLYVPVWTMWLLAIVTGMSCFALVAFAVTRVISQSITLRSVEEAIVMTRVVGGMTRSERGLSRPVQIVVEYSPFKNDRVVAGVFISNDAEKVLCGRYVLGRGRSGRQRFENVIDEVGATLSIARS